MNIEIILKNIASYKEEATLKTDKKINLTYGLNGTGKTILSNYLYEKSKEDKTEDWDNFKDCKDNIGEDVKILVYNEKFIEENLSQQIPGIFTLSSENKEAKKNIEHAQGILKQNKGEQEKLDIELKELEGDFKRRKGDSQKTVWTIKERYTGGDRLLDYCLEKFKGRKENLFKHLCEILKPKNNPEENIDDLKKILKSIEQGTKIQSISKLKIDPSTIENDSLFKEEIVGSQNSSIASLIEKLKNSNWIKEGLKYLPEEIKESTECPFCQEKTITEDLAYKIKNYFDQSYKKKTEKISELQTQYESFIGQVNKVKLDNQTSASIEEYQSQFEKSIYSLNLILSENLQQIENKKQNPSKKIALKDSKDQMTELNQIIDGINKKISEHNKKIEDSKTEKERIKGIFWKIMRLEYDQTIESYEKEFKKFEEDRKNLEGKQESIKEAINKQEKIIQKNQKQTLNLDTAISNINQNLKDLGIIDFKIEKKNDESYFLKRSSSNNSPNNSKFKSLSEGEKTVISFLYFLELCQGKSDRKDLSFKKSIVIDDPISSLSHIYVFNIAQFIKNRFFNNDQKNNYENVFILTHNLYFFHELTNYTIRREEREKKDKQTKLFRITKNTSSKIVEMGKEEIKNEYESYWEVLKDYESKEPLHPTMLPNITRNILEHFFGFIEKANLADKLTKIDSKKYGAFIRYMNRESHSDRTNISDMKEIDQSLFLEAFKEVFKKSGYEAHYNKMMQG